MRVRNLIVLRPRVRPAIAFTPRTEKNRVNEPGDLVLVVELQFVSELALHRLAPEKGTQPVFEVAQHTLLSTDSLDEAQGGDRRDGAGRFERQLFSGRRDQFLWQNCRTLAMEVETMGSSRIDRITAATGVIVAVAFGAVLGADHSWGNYHWARTTASFNLTVVNSTTLEWDPYVARAVSDWSASAKLTMSQDLSGSTADKDRRQCRAPSGEVRICNLAYGYNGWLGIAGISIDTNGHIVSGYTKLNDSYFSTSTYNSPQWRQSVTCQELGHNVGLDHQDEDFDNTSLFSCMDYQDPPYEFPNDHDYDQLETIYGHPDSYNSYTGGSSGGGDNCNAPPGKGCNKADVPQDPPGNAWGISLGRRGQKEKFLRVDPDGTRHITFVTWVKGY